MRSFIGGNVGEKDESIVIHKLVSLRGRYVNALGTKIESIADYSGTEYPARIQEGEIVKAPTVAKRDVLINGRGYSLKSIRASPPAIVNHTTREKWLRVCRRNGVKIAMLDEMVAEYWELRCGGEIGEDILSSDECCPFGSTKERRRYLKKLVTYFLFDGTGTKDSPYPADYIMEFLDPLDTSTWKILSRDTAFDRMWPRMIFCIRSKKGMPSNYPEMRDTIRRARIAPWVRYIAGDYRGALHIRTKKRTRALD